MIGEKGISKRAEQFIIVGLSILNALIFMVYIYTIDISQSGAFVQWLYSTNVKIYAAMIIIFMVTFVILLFLSKMFLKTGGGVDYKLSIQLQALMTVGISLIGFGLFLECILVERFKEVGLVNGNSDNFPLTAKIVAVVLMFIWIGVTCRSSSDIPRYTLWIMYAVNILVTFLLFYQPNPFCKNLGDEFHCYLETTIPCTETIYNVADGVPFDINTRGLYGHYGLFFALPLKIFGIQNLWTVAFLLALTACIAQIAILYIIHTFLPLNWMKVLFGTASVIFLNFYFPGVFPIRTFCPAVMCGFITYLYKQQNKILWTKRLLIGMIFCSLCLAWNFEMGVASVLGFTVYVIFEILQKNDISKANTFFWGLGLLLGIPFVTTIGAIAIVNTYNLFIGGELIFGTFFYPLIRNSQNYMLDLNRDNVLLGNHMWVYVIILLFGALGYALYDTHLFGRKDMYDQSNAVMAGVAVIGIFAFSYYINEARWGAVFIVHQVAIALCAIIMSKLYVGYSGWWGGGFLDQIKKAGIILTVGIISIYALRTINVPIVIREKVLSKAYSTEEVMADIDNMTKIVPENTYGVGCGVNIIWHTVGWDNHAKFRDTTALSSSSDVTYEVVINEVMNQKSFVINRVNDADLCEDILSRTSCFELLNTFQIGGYEYGYYHRKE